ncbi:sigma 54-interacting transcriptional regulator [Utexia brackfieldae]|uniref:sigma-54 interaction domain-containing protein n=1 Tax=Utexia brackfieldae TaxID=3074108 RepID=UPI00370DD805
MSIPLIQIQDFIQSYVDAISAILNVGVTVVDKDLVRIGGTNLYSEQIGKVINHGAFYRKVIETGQPGIMTKSQHNVLCAQCAFCQECTELADIAYPIFYENEVAGVIGLIAFSEESKHNLLANNTNFEIFLKHMSSLLESKLLTLKQNIQLGEQLDEVMAITRQQQDLPRFIGHDPCIEAMMSLVNRVCDSASTILITGESGTGKDVLAKTIHRRSHRAKHMMVSVNCGAIAESLIESELFGYEAGAFTGASKQGHMGKFELANGGTLFLDEIGEMSLSAQTKLLRVLQERVIQRIGGKKDIPVDVRVICATNQNLLKLVEEKKFRMDLFYRINVIPVTIPPLRERKSDIPLLISQFLAYFNQALKKSITLQDEKVLQTLIAYDWPGNVRELKNMVEYLVNIKEQGAVHLSDLPAHLVSKNFIELGTDLSLKDLMLEQERQLLKVMLVDAPTTEDKRQLAQKLGISLSSLYRKMAQYHLD